MKQPNNFRQNFAYAWDNLDHARQFQFLKYLASESSLCQKDLALFDKECVKKKPIGMYASCTNPPPPPVILDAPLFCEISGAAV